MQYAVTEKGFMTATVWEEHVVPDICQQINAVRQNKNKPEAWCIIVLDGFGVHSYNIKVHHEIYII